MLPNSMLLPLSLSQRFIKKTVHGLPYFTIGYLCAVFLFSHCSSRISWPAKIFQNFMTSNLHYIHTIALDVDQCWNIFSLHIFCSILIEQVIDLRKVRSYRELRTWNLGLYGSDEEHTNSLLCHSSTKRPVNGQNIEQSYEHCFRK